MKAFRFLLLFLFFGIATRAQIPVALPEAELPFTNYSSAEGLIHNRCLAIREDRLGYIWIATEMGISRYNGRSFRHFPCPGRAYMPVRNCMRSGGRVLFPISQFGVAAACGSEVRFFKCKNLRLSTVVGLAEYNDTTFLLSDQTQGLVLLRGTKGVQLPLPDGLAASGMLDMTRDIHGNVWLGTTNGLWILPNGRPDRMFRLSFWTGTYINTVRPDPEGNMYVTSAKGLHRYPAAVAARTADLQRTEPQFVMELVGLDYPSFHAELDGTLWIGTNPSGTIRLNSRTGRYEKFTPRNGFASHTVWDITGDHEGNLWFATENGLSRLSREDFMRYSFRYMSSELLSAACAVSDSELLVATDAPEHFLIRSDNSITRVKTPSQWASYWPDRIHRMANGELWISESIDRMPSRFSTHAYSRKGNELKRKRSVQEYPGAPLALDFSRSRAAMKDGSEWFCSESGLYHFDGKKFSFVPVTDADGARYIPASITSCGDSLLYVLRANAALYSYRLRKTDSARSLELKHKLIAHDIEGKSYYSIMADSRGWIWAASRQDGVLIWNGGNEPRTRLLGGSLTSAMVTSITEDPSGTMWIGTAGGLNRVRVGPSGELQLDADVYGAEFCDRYIYFVKAMGHKLYVGTSGCLGIIDLQRAHSSPAVPMPIYITGLQINGREQNSLLNGRTEIALSPDQNTMRIEFTALSFRDERRLRYRYRLRGLDKDWSSPTAEFRVTYSKIPPGKYEFEVMAFAPDGLQSAAPASFRFCVAQPFYTTWWFIGLCLLFVVFAIWAMYRYRINQILKMQQMRQRISKDLHDDIGATVSSIGILAEMVKSGRATNERRQQLLETISEESRYVAQTLSDIVWTINPRNDSMDAIFARMQRYAAEVFEVKGIQYEISLPDAIPDGAMDMQSRQHLYLIFKEAVNNLIKYSGATEAGLILKVQGRRLLMDVRDNGRGFEMQAAQHGNGMMNMRKRAEEMLARLEIHSAPGEGTLVHLDAPIHL